MVLANIVADVIIGLKPIVPEFLKDGAILITSGIIDDRKEDVLAAYETAGLTLIGEAEQGGWVSLVYQK